MTVPAKTLVEYQARYRLRVDRDPYHQPTVIGLAEDGCVYASGNPDKIWGYQSYRRNLCEAFAAAATDPLTQIADLEMRAEPARQFIEEMRHQRKTKLPYAAEAGNQPFAASSGNLDADLKRFENPVPGGDPLYALVVTDKTKDGYHICVINITGEPDVFSAQEIPAFTEKAQSKSLLESSLGKLFERFRSPVHFYQHVPPERAENGRGLFRQVILGRALNANAELLTMDLDALPAGIDVAISHFYTKLEAFSRRNPFMPSIYSGEAKPTACEDLWKEIRRSSAHPHDLWANIFDYADSKVPIQQHNNGHEDYRNMALRLHKEGVKLAPSSSEHTPGA